MINLAQIIHNRLTDQPGSETDLEQCRSLHSNFLGEADYFTRMRGVYEVLHSVSPEMVQTPDKISELLIQGLQAATSNLSAADQTTYLLGLTACYRLSPQSGPALVLCLKERPEAEWDSPGAVAECFLKLAQSDSALPYAQRELQLATSPIRLSLANIQLGRIYVQLTQYDNAEKAFLEVIESGVSHRWAARELCQLYLSQMANQKALELADRMLSEERAEPFLSLRSNAVKSMERI